MVQAKITVEFQNKKMHDGRTALFQDVEDLALRYDCNILPSRPGVATIFGNPSDLEELRERLNDEGLL